MVAAMRSDRVITDLDIVASPCEKVFRCGRECDFTLSYVQILGCYKITKTKLKFLKSDRFPVQIVPFWPT